MPSAGRVDASSAAMFEATSQTRTHCAAHRAARASNRVTNRALPVHSIRSNNAFTAWPKSPVERPNQIAARPSQNRIGAGEFVPTKPTITKAARGAWASKATGRQGRLRRPASPVAGLLVDDVTELSVRDGTAACRVPERGSPDLTG